jgi:hypothetical protein
MVHKSDAGISSGRSCSTNFVLTPVGKSTLTESSLKLWRYTALASSKISNARHNNVFVEITCSTAQRMPPEEKCMMSDDNVRTRTKTRHDFLFSFTRRTNPTEKFHHPHRFVTTSRHLSNSENGSLKRLAQKRGLYWKNKDI